MALDLRADETDGDRTVSSLDYNTYDYHLAAAEQ
jgi:hypothetical protein